VLVSVPAHLRGLSTLADGDLAGVRQIISSGAPLDNDTAMQLDRFGARVTEVLGSSETGGIAYRRPPEDWWHPLPGVDVQVDADGRLLLDSPYADPPRPYLGADRIELGREGAFRHLGRADGVVKVAGKRVSLSEMEQRLRAIPGVRDAAVTAVAVESGRGNEIWAVVAGEAVAPSTIRNALRQWFDPVVLPRRLRVVQALPREATGKLTRQRLLSLFEGDMTTEGQGRRDFDVQSRRQSQEGKVERAEVVLGVPEDLFFLRGHFHNYPILAAVVILNNIVLAETQRAWPDLKKLVSLSRLKFKRPIHPRETITMRLERKQGESSVTFNASVGEHECNSGTLNFEASA
jgi:3-hydroxymyristoyl/3-hydroxydecanoyl-(acyl carrier protein) dehydratase